MAVLTTQQRKNMPDSTYALPDERKYPIPDESHARNALARVSGNGTADEQAQVRAAVRRKFKDISVAKGGGK